MDIRDFQAQQPVTPGQPASSEFVLWLALLTAFLRDIDARLTAGGL